MRTAVVIVASTRAATGEYTDTSGPIAVDYLRSKGFDTPDPRVVADENIASAISQVMETNPPSVLLTSGGTGITPDDVTVDALEPWIDKPLPGLVHDFFTRGIQATPTAVASRCVAGMSGSTFVMALPGSNGGVKDGIATLDPVLLHLVELAEGHTAHHHAAHTHAHPKDTNITETTPDEHSQVHAYISRDPIEPTVTDLKKQLTTTADGAVITFEGVVRNHDQGARVKSLDYTCHPTADNEIQRVTQEVSNQFPAVRLAAIHRIGHLGIGDLAFVALAFSAHRKEAFEALSLLTDRVKAEVPIWKEQELTDGSTQWVGIE